MNREKEILNNSIADHQKSIDSAKKRLAALDKPVLQHGDCGFRDRKRFVYINNKSTIDTAFYKDNTYCSNFVKNKHYDPETSYIVSNLFDTLVGQNKDLKEFKLARSCVPFGCSLRNNGIRFYHRMSHAYSWFTLEEAIEIQKQLTRLIGTQKRKESKC